MQTGNIIVTKRVGSRRCWALSTFFKGGFIRANKGNHRERAVRELLASHRLCGNGDFPDRRNKYYHVVDSNLSLSTTVV